MSIFYVLLLLSLCIFSVQVHTLRAKARNKPCKHRGPNFVCIPIWTCPYYVDLLERKQKGSLMIRSSSICGNVDPDTPKVCCGQLDLEQRSTTTTSTERVLTVNDFEGYDLQNHPNRKQLPLDVCGALLPTDARITGGIQASPGEFPWMALLVYHTSHGFDYKCIGTLINDEFILTAAHCLMDSNLIGVRLGAYDVIKDDKCDKSGEHCKRVVQDHNIKNVKIHPLYNSKTQMNDIALVQLFTKAKLADNVKPICLPFAPAMDGDIDQVKEAIVAGWGVTEAGTKSAILRKVDVPIVGTKACQRKYDGLKPISERQVCAGGSGGKDSCAGDSGGPLQFIGTFQDQRRFIQHGIVSYGPKLCGKTDLPAVYTKVAEYMNWILDNIDSEELSSF